MNFAEQKRAVLELLLPLCPFIAVDATQAGVVVPESLKREDLVLRIGRHPKVMPMPDLVLDDDGWSATLSLPNGLQHVTIPWEACSRCWIGEPFVGPFVVWPEAAQAPKPPPAPRGPSLRIVKGGTGDA